MTAEVAVMNKLGVALAADSAVTVSNRVSNRDADKTYSSSDKLFQLSDTAPVAFMKSGNADFLGMPWEVLVEAYRKQLGNSTFPRLSGYATDFFRFVSKFVRTDAIVFPQSVQDAWIEFFVKNWLMNIFDKVDDRYEEDEKENSAQADKRKSSIIHEVTAEFLEAKKEDPKLPRFGAATLRAMRAKYGTTVKKEIREFFEYFSLPPHHPKPDVENLIFESISRANFDSDDATNIVFAGFGEEEYFPAYLKYAVDGWADGKLRHYCDEEGRISPEKSGDVGLFGQNDPALAAVLGFSPDFLPFVSKGIDETVEKMMKSFTRVTSHKYTAHEEKKLYLIAERYRRSLIEEIIEDVKEVGEEFEEAVGHLPISELAATAEALVNITKFRQRVSADQETVGGPIDVAVITKGDGFVWVKKKQYFPADINPLKVSGG